MQWSFGDGTKNSNPKADSIVLHNYDNYSKDTSKDFVPSVTITFSDGTTCSTTYSGLILVYDKPNVKIYLGSLMAQCIYTNSFCFTDSSTGGRNIKSKVLKYNWDFGDGSYDSIKKPACHSFTKTGIHTVSLKVYDDSGCTNTGTKNVYVISDTSIVFALSKSNPMGFTMNLDTTGWHIVKFMWNYGDTSALDSLNFKPAHSYHHDGRYPVTFSIWTREGCFISATDTVNVLRTGIAENSLTAFEYKIYPNPSQGNFNIEYSLSENAHINMLLYDMTGRKISELINQNQSSGNHSLHSDNFSLPDGTYILKIFKDYLPAGQGLIIVHQ